MPPKTGSTSLSKLCWDGLLKGYEFPRNLPRHMTVEEAIYEYQINDISNWTVYQTARNPVSKFQSSIRHQTDIINNKNITEVHLDPEKILDLIQSYVDRPVQTHFAVRYIIKKAFKIQDDPEDAKSNYRYGERFYFLQSRWSDCTKVKVKYLKLEDDKKETFEKLKVNSNTSFPHANKSKKLDINYSQYIIKKISTLYKKDYEVLKYALD